MIIHPVFADPITLTAIGTGLAGLAGAGTLAATLFAPKPKAPTAPTPAPPVLSPTGTQTSNAPQQGPSFLAAAVTPNTNQLSGSKTLLGQ